MARKKHFRSRKGMGTMGKVLIGGVGYGILREPINQLARNLPLIGGLGDEVAMGALSYLAATRGSGIFRTLGRAGLFVEAHNIGRNLSAGGLNLFGLNLGGSSTMSTSGETPTF